LLVELECADVVALDELRVAAIEQRLRRGLRLLADAGDPWFVVGGGRCGEQQQRECDRAAHRKSPTRLRAPPMTHMDAIVARVNLDW
jgi:hypothetical protein